MNISEILTKSNFTNSVIKELYVKSSEVTNDTTEWFTEYVIERLCEEVERLNSHEKENAKIEDLEDEISNLQGEISDLEDIIEDFEDEKSNLESDIDDLKSDLSDANETIAGLESEIISEKEENENLRMRLHE